MCLELPRTPPEEYRWWRGVRDFIICRCFRLSINLFSSSVASPEPSSSSTTVSASLSTPSNCKDCWLEDSDWLYPLVLRLLTSAPRKEVSNVASFGPLPCGGNVKEVFRLGTIIGSSSLEDSVEDVSQFSFDADRPPLELGGLSWTTTVSVRALPLESIVNLTSVRDLGGGSSGIDDRLGGRCCFMGERRPVRGFGRSSLTI